MAISTSCIYEIVISCSFEMRAIKHFYDHTKWSFMPLLHHTTPFSCEIGCFEKLTGWQETRTEEFSHQFGHSLLTSGAFSKLRLRSVKTVVAWSLFFVLKMQGYMGRGSPLLCHKLIKLATFSADNKNCRWRDYAMSQIWNYGRFAICHWCKILPRHRRCWFFESACLGFNQIEVIETVRLHRWRF